MRSARASLLLALLLLVSTLPRPMTPARAAADEWSSHGPYGGSISALAIDPQHPNILYASAGGIGFFGTIGGALFKSTDSGATWRASNAGLPSGDDGEILALAIDPQVPSTLYLGTRRAGVFKSIDSGATWRATGLADSSPGRIYDLAINTMTPSTLYAATEYAIYKSNDGGGSWFRSGPTSEDFISLAIDPITPTILYVAGRGFEGFFDGVFKSMDGGAHWEQILDGAVSDLAIDPVVPSTLYTSYQGGISKSTDGGAHWTPINTGLPADTMVSMIAINPKAPATLYASLFRIDQPKALGYIYKSTNGGASWTLASTGLPNLGAYVVAIDPITPTTLYVGTGGVTLYVGTGGIGIFKSTDAAAHWSASTVGINALSVNRLRIDPSVPTTLYAITQGRGNFKSIDGGATWQYMGVVGQGVMDLAIDPSNSSTLYAAGDGVYKSTDGGAHWLPSDRGVEHKGVFALALDPNTPGTLYAGTGNAGLFKSVDGGASWYASSSGLDNSIGFFSIAIDPIVSSTIYVGTGKGVFKSIDGGMHWQPTNLAAPVVWALAIDPSQPQTIYAGTVDFLTGGMYKSSDGGNTWYAINTGLTDHDVYALAIDPNQPSVIYAGTDGGGVFRSSGGGNRWFPFNPGLTNPRIQSLALTPTLPARLYAGTLSGAFDITTPLVSTMITPEQAETLVYTDDQGLDTVLQVPSGAVTTTTQLVFTPLPMAATLSAQITAGHAFELAAYRGSARASSLNFSVPVTLTARYSDADVRTISAEDQLTLRWWNGSAWVDAASTCAPAGVYQRDLTANTISTRICRVGRYALFGPTHNVFVPRQTLDGGI